MAVTLAQLVSDSVSLALKFGENVLNLTYTPSKVSAARIAELGKLELLKGEERIEAIVRLAESLLVSWDLVNPDGTEVPITLESLRNVSMLVINRVIQEILQDIQLGEANGAQSPTA